MTDLLKLVKNSYNKFMPVVLGYSDTGLAISYTTKTGLKALATTDNYSSVTCYYEIENLEELVSFSAGKPVTYSLETGGLMIKNYLALVKRIDSTKRLASDIGTILEKIVPDDSYKVDLDLFKRAAIAVDLKHHNDRLIKVCIDSLGYSATDAHILALLYCEGSEYIELMGESRAAVSYDTLALFKGYKDLTLHRYSKIDTKEVNRYCTFSCNRINLQINNSWDSIYPNYTAIIPSLNDRDPGQLLTLSYEAATKLVKQAPKYSLVLFRKDTAYLALTNEWDSELVLTGIMESCTVTKTKHNPNNFIWPVVLSIEKVKQLLEMIPKGTELRLEQVAASRALELTVDGVGRFLIMPVIYKDLEVELI